MKVAAACAPGTGCEGVTAADSESGSRVEPPWSGRRAPCSPRNAQMCGSRRVREAARNQTLTLPQRHRRYQMVACDSGHQVAAARKTPRTAIGIRGVNYLEHVDESQYTLGTRIRQLRLSNGISVETAARATGVAAQTWRRWEVGRSAYRPWRAPAIAAALNVPVASLFSDAVVFEVVLEPQTVEDVRHGGREAATVVAERLARRLESAIYAEATRKQVDISAGARAKPRRTRAQVLRGVNEANRMRKAALDRRSQPPLVVA